MNIKNIETIEQISRTYTAPHKETRTSCRAIIVKNGKMLFSFESKTGFYMSPGGSLEEGESFEECCIRELKEETGFIVNPLKQFITVKEYCYDILYISHYFICEITGECERALTGTEIFKGMQPEWLDTQKAIEIFGTYKEQTPDKESLYLRELTVLNKYLAAVK